MRYSVKLVFNGAALFQVRKAFRLADPTTQMWVFNGAALFQVRKVA